MVNSEYPSAFCSIDGAIVKPSHRFRCWHSPNDTQAQAEKLADKICGLRVFADEAGKMNLNLAAVGGALLVVSQFTLYADIKSRRPGFSLAVPGGGHSCMRPFLDPKAPGLQVSTCLARTWRCSR